MIEKSPRQYTNKLPVREGGPAFARPMYRSDGEYSLEQDGLSARDYFAAHAPAQPQAWFEPECPGHPGPRPHSPEWHQRWNDSDGGWGADDPPAYIEYAKSIAQHSRLLHEWSVKKECERHKQWPYAWADMMIRQRDRVADLPDVVCLCGSTRFMDEFHEEGFRLTLEGAIVLSVGVAKHIDIEDGGHAGEALGDEVCHMLDMLHFRKIDLADRVFVLNVGGYIGPSTAREIAYAVYQDKPVGFLDLASGGSFMTSSKIAKMVHEFNLGKIPDLPSPDPATTDSNG